MGNGGFQVFKSPERVQSTLIAADGMLTQSRVRSDDCCLLSYFFDHKSIGAFVPESLKKHPALYERLVKTPAEISLRPDNQFRPGGLDGLAALPGVHRGFYHSGTLAGEENRVAQRAIRN
jgi:hypothetical protein